MIEMAWRSLLNRKLSILAALLSVVLGAALVTATVLIASTQDRDGADSVTAWRFSAVDAVVIPPASVTLNSGFELDLPSMPRLSDEEIAAIESATGVSSVSLEAPFPAYAMSGDGSLIGDAFTRSWGHPWSSAIADGGTLVAGSAPTAGDEIVVDGSVAEAGGIRVGDGVEVQLATGVQQFIVTGIVTRPGEQFEHALFFDQDTATTLGGTPVLALVSTSDVDALRSAVPDLTVATGDARAGSLQLDLRQAELAGGTSQFLLMIALLVLTVAVFVVSSTLTVSIGQRRRELAMLRVVGTKPRLIRRMIRWEAVLIGAAGGIAGSLLGVALAELARDFFVAQGLMARGAVVDPNPVMVSIGAGTALLATFAAAVLPAHRATRIAPLEALRESEAPASRANRRRSWAGSALSAAAILCLAGMFTLGGPVTTMEGSIAFILWATAFPLLIGAAVLLGPNLLHGVVTVTRPLAGRGYGGFMAFRSIRSDLRRAAGVGVPLTLLVAVSSVLMFQDSANYQARSEVYAQQLTADLVVTGGVQLGVPLGSAAAAREVSGVEAASASVSSSLIIDSPATARAAGTVIGVDPDGFAQVLDFPLVAGSWEGFDAGGIGVSTVVAADKGWRVGDTIEFRYPDGVAGSAMVHTVYTDPMGSSDLVLPLASLTPHLLERYATAVYIAVAPGADLETTRRAVDAALDGTAPTAVTVNREEHLEQVATQASGDNWIIVMVAVILGGYAGVSAINALISSTMARRREFALLRLAGSRRRQIVASLALESLVITATAIIAGTVIAAITMIGYGYLLTDTIWLPFVEDSFIVIVGGALLAAGIGTLAPARAAMRATPLEAVR